MCQLTLLKMQENNPELGYALLFSLLVENTRSDHKHGVGFSFKDTDKKWYTYKETLAPSLNLNFAQSIKENVTISTNPIIAHVRKASTIYKDKDIVLDHVHPFVNQEKSLILAHNGTLHFDNYQKGKEMKKAFPNKIDSQHFLYVLTQKYAKKDATLPSALREAMKEFNGKFAFLIREKATNTVYVVRGSTAKLHISHLSLEGKRVATLINTEKSSFYAGLFLARNLYFLKTGEVLDYTKPEELEKESIFKLQDSGDLDYVDKIKETSPYYSGGQTEWNRFRGRKRSVASDSSDSNANSEPVVFSNVTDKKTKAGVRAISKYLDRYEMTIKEFDLLLNQTIGVTLLEMTSTDFRKFGTEFAPIFEEYIDTESKAGKKKRKSWRKIKRNLKLDWNGNRVYTDERVNEKLQYPYFLTDTKTLHDIEVESRKIRRETEKAA